MRKSEKTASQAKSKKAYSKPKLTTHGDVRKVTQHPGKSPPGRGAGSGIFDFGGGDGGHDEGRGNGWGFGKDRH